MNFFVLNELFKLLLVCNSLFFCNFDLFFFLWDDCIFIVLYVYFRFEYLKFVVFVLFVVNGINEIFLIVSYDGFYEEMNVVVEFICFC